MGSKGGIGAETQAPAECHRIETYPDSKQRASFPGYYVLPARSAGAVGSPTPGGVILLLPMAWPHRGVISMKFTRTTFVVAILSIVGLFEATGPVSAASPAARARAYLKRKALRARGVGF